MRNRIAPGQIANEEAIVRAIVEKQKKENEMSARRTEPRLIARKYEPPAENPPERSLMELFRGLEKRETPDRPELHPSERGTGISLVRLKGTRDQTVLDDALGGYLKDSRQPVTVIEAAGAVTIAARMGAQFFPMRNFSPIPRETSIPTLEWITEGNAPSEDSAFFGLISPKIHTGVVSVDFSQVLSSASGSLVDRILTASFFKSLGRGVDAAIFGGAGTGGAPRGIVATPGVDTGTGGSYAIADAAAQIGAVETGNANTSTISWCMDPASAELLRQRPKVAGGERMIFEDEKILDRPAYVSNSINAGTIFCGSFSDVLVLVREIEIVFNPYSQSKHHIRELCGFWHGDVVVQHPGYFSVRTSVT